MIWNGCHIFLFSEWKPRSSSEEVVAVLSLCLIQFQLEFYLMCMRCAHNRLWYSPWRGKCTKQSRSFTATNQDNLTGRLCKPNKELLLFLPVCRFIIPLITAEYWPVLSTLTESYHATKIIGSTCLFYIKFQLPVAFPYIKENGLCVSVLFQTISGLTCREIWNWKQSSSLKDEESCFERKCENLASLHSLSGTQRHVTDLTF